LVRKKKSIGPKDQFRLNTRSSWINTNWVESRTKGWASTGRVEGWVDSVFGPTQVESKIELGRTWPNVAPGQSR